MITKIEYTENDQFVQYMDNLIHKTINPLDPNRFRVSAYRFHRWDGRRILFNQRTHELPTGLFDELYYCIKEDQVKHPEIKVKIDDQRGPKIEVKVPKEIFLKESNRGEVKLYPHQMKAVQEAFKKQQLTLDNATGSGKTLEAAAIIKLAMTKLNKYSDHILFISESKTIAHQVQERLETNLGQPIGFWGDGEDDIQFVTVAMIGTVKSALKRPEDVVKLTSQKDKVLMHMVKDYVPKFINKTNVALTIKSFIRNNKPKYSYDETIFASLANMVASGYSNRDLIKNFKSYQDQYDKLLRRKNKKVFEKYEWATDLLESVKVMIQDEAQHSVADSYQKVYPYMRNARMKVALTGTVPQKKENIVRWKTFKGNFGPDIYKVTSKAMIDKGVLAKPVIQIIPIEKPTDLDAQVDKQLPLNLPKASEDLIRYQTLYRTGITENDYRNQVIAKLAYKLSQTGAPSIIVVNSIEHGEIIKEFLDDLNVTSEFMQGSKTTDQRDSILANIKSGKTKVLIGTQMIDEGMDLPNLKYLIYASAGKSSRQVIQRIGRVLRITPTKKSAIIFDIQDRTCNLLYRQAKSRLQVYRDQQFPVKEIFND